MFDIASIVDWKVGLAAIFVGCFYKKFFHFRHPTIPDSPVEGSRDAGDITLFQFQRVAPAVGSASPACAKLECFLRMSKIPYKICRDPSMSKNKKGKLPFITHGETLIADSTFATKYLVNTFSNSGDKQLGDIKLDLEPKRAAVAIAVQRICEDHLYWVLVYFRWVKRFDLIMSKYFGFLPSPVRMILGPVIRKWVYSDVWATGIARHSDKDILLQAQEDFTALSSLLGDDEYIGGDRPCIADTTLFAWVEQLSASCFVGPLQDLIRSDKRLLAYAERVRQAYWSDQLQNSDKTSKKD